MRRRGEREEMTVLKFRRRMKKKRAVKLFHTNR